MMIKNPDGSYDLAGTDIADDHGYVDSRDHPDAAALLEELAQIVQATTDPFPQST
jgi:hypothetical protein